MKPKTEQEQKEEKIELLIYLRKDRTITRTRKQD
jgi:hypothetical protein